MKEIKLNYQELAFIMDLSTNESKDLFMDMCGIDKVKKTELISVNSLINKFNHVKSVDSRYDGQNELLFALEMKKDNYKKYLNEKSYIKNLKFSGGKTIYYKILDNEQLDHALEQFKMKHIYLWGDKSLDERIILNKSLVVTN